MSKFIPNSFQTPNILVDEWLKKLTPVEGIILVLIIRETSGWNKDISKKLPVDYIVSMIKPTKPTTLKGLKGLKELGLITEHGSESRGYSYSFNWEISGERSVKKPTKIWFDDREEWLKNLTDMRTTSGKKILPLVVKYFNHLYIKPNIKPNIKKYIKKFKEESALKSKEDSNNEVEKTTAPKKQEKDELDSQKVFEEFKSKFEFLNFVDYVRMVKHLKKLNGALTKNRISKNLGKCKMKDGSFVSVEDFNKVIDDFVAQEHYRGVFVSWEIQTGKAAGIKGRANKAEDLPEKKSENNMSDEELDALVAKASKEVA